MKKFGIKFMMMGLFAILGIGIGVVALPTQTHAQVGLNTDQQGFGGVKETQGIGVAGAGNQNTGGSLITIIKNLINWALGLLGLIALVVLLRGGFQMVTAAGDEEKYKTGFKILKQAAIGLAFIGISFFVVTMIFSVINKISGGNETDVQTAAGGGL